MGGLPHSNLGPAVIGRGKRKSNSGRVLIEMPVGQGHHLSRLSLVDSGWMSLGTVLAGICCGRPSCLGFWHLLHWCQ